MRLINHSKLIQTMLQGAPPDSKALLADVDHEAVIRALKKSKDGLPRPVTFTNAPMEEENLAKMPRRDKDQLWKLYDRIREVPEEVLPKLLNLQQRYPNVPAIYNYIGLAYFHSRQADKYLEALHETVERFPEYLFGKISLIEYHLHNDQHQKVPEILEGKFELPLHYPTVDMFHVSEVRAFFSVVGTYFARVNNLTRALYHYRVLTDIAPDHPATKKVGDEIILKEISKLRRTFTKKRDGRKR